MLLSRFLLTAQQLHRGNPALHFALPLTTDAMRELAVQILAETPLEPGFRERIEISVGNSREVIRRASAGLAASGTVTVEAAILGLPVVVSYRGSFLTYLMARLIVHLPYITIANLVTKRMLFQECLQYDAVPEKMGPALAAILPGGSRRQEVLAGMDEFVRALGEGGAISETVADNVLEVIGEPEDGR
jgi:lipid-A-disaccharide synthase